MEPRAAYATGRAESDAGPPNMRKHRSAYPGDVKRPAMGACSAVAALTHKG